jgi:cell division transport system permease protein
MSQTAPDPLDGHRPAAILPPRNLAGPALVAVTMVMSFLACLALGNSLLANQAAERWLARATSAVSVQIVETRAQTADEQLPVVLRVIDAMPGIASVRVLEKPELIGLLEPWLGSGNVGDDLPLPVLIEIHPDASGDFPADALSVELQSVAPGARLDTHGKWRQTLEGAARALNFFAALVLTMVTLATGTVILFATRAGLLANQEILDVLHQIGAHDSYISRRFEGHFVRLTLLAALSGTLAACLFFYLFGTILPDARNSDLYIWLLPVPLGAVFLSWQVTRHHVIRNLRARL